MPGLLGMAEQQQVEALGGLTNAAEMASRQAQFRREVSLGEQEGIGALVGQQVGMYTERRILENLMRQYGLEPPQSAPATGTHDTLFGHLLQSGIEYAGRLFGTGVDRSPVVESTGGGK